MSSNLPRRYDRISIALQDGNHAGTAMAADITMGLMNPAIGLEGLWIIDADASTVYANSAMCDILGTEAAELIGSPSFDYIFPEDVDAARRLFETRQRGGMSPFHFRLRRKDDSEVWVDVQGTPMHSSTGQFLGIVGTFRVSGEESGVWNRANPPD